MALRDFLDCHRLVLSRCDRAAGEKPIQQRTKIVAVQTSRHEGLGVFRADRVAFAGEPGRKTVGIGIVNTAHFARRNVDAVPWFARRIGEAAAKAAFAVEHGDPANTWLARQLERRHGSSDASADYDD